MDLPKQDNYEKALEIGLDIFSRKDPAWIANQAGARFPVTTSCSASSKHARTVGSRNQEILDSGDWRRGADMAIDPLFTLSEFRHRRKTKRSAKTFPRIQGWGFL